MVNNAFEFEWLKNLSEGQQERVSGGMCVETTEDNYALIECSHTVTETTTEEEDETTSSFPFIPMVMSARMGPSRGFTSLRFPRISF